MADTATNAPWLDLSINDHLRKLVNAEGICRFDRTFKEAHTPICVMMDRVADSGSWLNAHASFPPDVDTFILFLVHSDIVIKTILKAVAKLKLNNPYGNGETFAARQFLSPHCTNATCNSTNQPTPEDRVVWSYLRALAFAHTEETGARVDQYQDVFLSKDEIQYSPFPLIGIQGNRVGVAVYSNLRGSVPPFMLPYDALKRFVSSRFALVGLIAKEAEKRIRARKREHRRAGLDESDGPIPTLQRMRNLYAERFGEEYAIHFAHPLMLLTCVTTNPENDSLVSDFRNELSARISDVAAFFRRGDYETCIQILNEFCDHLPKDVPQEANHSLQTAFSHLKPGDEHRTRAIDAVHELAKGFVGRFVKVNADTMSNEELQLLLSVACWCYRKENGLNHSPH